jgi:hypothetical protein
MTATPEGAGVASGKPNASKRRHRCPACGELPPRPRPPRDPHDAEAYREYMLRNVARYAARIAEGGVESLRDAVAVRDALDAVIDGGVAVCRSEAWSASWGEIAGALGRSTSTVAEKYEGVGGARRPGGQPANLR